LQGTPLAFGFGYVGLHGTPLAFGLGYVGLHGTPLALRDSFFVEVEAVLASAIAQLMASIPATVRMSERNLRTLRLMAAPLLE
jgi:hypothetical protein